MLVNMKSTDTMLCGHPQMDARKTNNKLLCPHCYSFEEHYYLKREYKDYGANYAQTRGHFDDEVGRLKALTLKNWLNKAQINPSLKNIFEVGFGGAYGLNFMQNLGAQVFGCETSKEHINHAVELGLPPTNLFLSDKLPEKLSTPIDIWLLLDSFEHLLNPEKFMNWVAGNSAPNNAILMVLPRADSLSSRLLGQLSPHRLPDHHFHWSKKGLLGFMSKWNYKLILQFYPLKTINLGVIAKHLAVHSRLHLPLPKAIGNRIIHFNFGEMGLLFKHDKS